ncbi:MAG TPA: hypothetical protein VF813_06035, partial [Anaerolineaceae bacterium]
MRRLSMGKEKMGGKILGYPGNRSYLYPCPWRRSRFGFGWVSRTWHVIASPVFFPWCGNLHAALEIATTHKDHEGLAMTWVKSCQATFLGCVLPTERFFSSIKIGYNDFAQEEMIPCLTTFLEAGTSSIKRSAAG